jgi:hypothetical protein
MIKCTSCIKDDGSELTDNVCTDGIAYYGCGGWPYCQEANCDGMCIEYVCTCKCHHITEYALDYTSGDKLIMHDNEIYPVERRVKYEKKFGKKFLTRKIIVVEDWSEYDLPDRG